MKSKHQAVCPNLEKVPRKLPATSLYLLRAHPEADSQATAEGRREQRLVPTRSSLLHGDGDGVTRNAVDYDFDLLRA